MSFRAVFIALVISTALLVTAYTINWYRPRIVTEQPTAELVRASGKCAECNSNLQIWSSTNTNLAFTHERRSTAWSFICPPRGRKTTTITASSSAPA